MRTLVTVLVSLVLSVVPAVAATAEQSDVGARVAETVDSYVRNRGFNGVVLVASSDGGVVEQARGVSSLELGADLQPNDIFRIGSLTKPLTAVLVLSLVNDGRLRLDGTLGEYLPELYAGTPASAATVEQLLAHTSGLKDVPGSYHDPFWQTAARQTFAPEEFAKAWILPEISSAPGKWRYNNNGFFLLGLIVERVTQGSYAVVRADEQALVAGDAACVSLNGGELALAGRPAFDAPAQPVLISAVGEHPRLQGGGKQPVVRQGSIKRQKVLRVRIDTRRREAHRRIDDHRPLHHAKVGPRIAAHHVRHDRSHAIDPAVGHAGRVEHMALEGDGTVVVILNNFWQGATVVEMARDLFAVAHGAPARTPKRLLGDLLTPIAAREDIDGMEAAFRAAPTTGDEAYDVSEGALNSLGYSLFRKGLKESAVRVFEWNVAAHPESANVHDSLGEAYLGVGRSEDARQSYEKALSLDPTSASARTALAALQGA